MEAWVEQPALKESDVRRKIAKISSFIDIEQQNIQELESILECIGLLICSSYILNSLLLSWY